MLFLGTGRRSLAFVEQLEEETDGKLDVHVVLDNAVLEELMQAEELARVVFTAVIGKPMKEELAMAEDVSDAEVDGSKMVKLAVRVDVFIEFERPVMMDLAV